RHQADSERDEQHQHNDHQSGIHPKEADPQIHDLLLVTVIVDVAGIALADADSRQPKPDQCTSGDDRATECSHGSLPPASRVAPTIAAAGPFARATKRTFIDLTCAGSRRTPAR